MDSSLVCRHCRSCSSVTPTTQNIRCHGCQRLLLLGDNQSNSIKEWSHDQENFKIEPKGLRSSLRKKFSSSNNNNSYDQVVIGRTTLSINPSQIPKKGKRAFLCGVTYKNQKIELKGAAQDVKNMRDLLLQHFDFPVESILILAEEESYRPPTRKNMEEAFEWLVRGVHPGDSLVFYFSGHGLRQRDLLGDELDGFDETICPVDFSTNGMIFDNCINKAIVRPLIPGVTLHAIVDSCHSGTILDLPYVYNTSTGEWENNKPPSGDYKGTSGGKAICFSACEDYQLAADTSALSPEKKMSGAMTSALINAVKNAYSNKQTITYVGLLDSMTEALKKPRKATKCIHAGIDRVFRRKIVQDPLLSSSEKFSTSREFKL